MNISEVRKLVEEGKLSAEEARPTLKARYEELEVELKTIWHPEDSRQIIREQTQVLDIVGNLTGHPNYIDGRKRRDGTITKIATHNTVDLKNQQQWLKTGVYPK